MKVAPYQSRQLTEADLTPHDLAIFEQWQAATKKDDILLALTVKENQRLLDVLAIKLGYCSPTHLPPKSEDSSAIKKRSRKPAARRRRTKAVAQVITETVGA